MNPWTRNPWMSLWLSAANTMMSTAHGYASSHARRNGATWMEHQAKQAADAWIAMMMPRPVSIARPARKRRANR